MRVYQAQAAEAGVSHAIGGQVREEYGVRIANNRHAHPATAVQQYPDLPVDRAGYFGQRTGKFGRDQLFGAASPSGQALQLAKRLGLEPFCIPVERNELQPFDAELGVSVITTKRL
ncbi:MAG: hypothetical protein IIB38_08850 [Candidatus Hydrogenedentes bacterium]|nr:hypothetical protein [Candidatus Hydrogenedentota bacterium]